MDKQDAPGIVLQGIDLLGCRIGNVKPAEAWAYNLALVQKQRVESEDGKNLFYYFDFDLMAGIKTPPFDFACSFVAHYSRTEDTKMTWGEFKDLHALAHVLPYLREFVVNMTTRLPAPLLKLPPTNVFRLLKEYEAKHPPVAAPPAGQ